MAFKRMLASPFFSIAKFSRPILTSSLLSPSPSAFQILSPPTPPDKSRSCLLRQWKPMYNQSEKLPPEVSSFPMGGNLRECLRDLDIRKLDRIRFEGLTDPLSPTSENQDLTVETTKKLINLAQLHMAKSRLRLIKKHQITYSELINVCSEDCSNLDMAVQYAEILGKSGFVIVMGDTVYTKPEQVTKFVQRAILPLDEDNPRWKEFQQMELQRKMIDMKAASMVRRELWGGFGYLISQTIVSIALTYSFFSWNEMEPVCFFITSIYFIFGYAFFLGTAIEPSFNGFYNSRFQVKKKKLVKKFNFDNERYEQLRVAFYPYLDDMPGNCNGFEFAPPLLDHNNGCANINGLAAQIETEGSGVHDVLCLVHSDLHDNKTSAVLEYLSSMVASIESVFNNNGWIAM
ncbi:calcium uniporter protein 2, mitochondrial-like [Impatiens glandulifera]|uniref:calcium uniporter protein 2, mitochondrial-like n=1 Tax=Impatiens glandulifera TaxID=253017 RepID=UPI001FB19674|nr:calcium uniporter protein 2, mitochondrial-like [Impatiens glandulifera]